MSQGKIEKRIPLEENDFRELKMLIVNTNLKIEKNKISIKEYNQLDDFKRVFWTTPSKNPLKNDISNQLFGLMAEEKFILDKNYTKKDLDAYVKFLKNSFNILRNNDNTYMIQTRKSEYQETNIIIKKI
jgi:hypothetical protein